MSNKLTQTQISTTQSRPDCWQCPGPSSLDCDKMNLENFSRKVAAGCIPPRDIGWILVITHYTGYLPRVLTDRHQHHLKVPRPHTSTVGKKKLVVAGAPCKKSLRPPWPAQTDRISDGLLPLSEKSPVTTLMTDLSLAVYLSEKSPVTTVMTPTVYKDCWGSLSIYCYDIQPLDIPKYVKKLLF